MVGGLRGTFDNPHKQLVDSCIVGQFRVKGGTQHASLPYGYDTSVLQSGQYFYAISHLVNHGRPDKHGVKGGPSSCSISRSLSKLSTWRPKAFPAHLDIHQAQRYRPMVGKVVCYDDETSTGAPHRHPGLRLLLYRLPEVVDVDELSY